MPCRTRWLSSARAAAAGREVGRGKLWSVFATACDVSEETYRYIVARLATYLQIPGYGVLVEINGWDPEVLQRFRTSEAVSVGGPIDSVAYRWRKSRR